MRILPGQVFDAESGLFQNHHREYQNLTGKYTQVDPLGFKGGDFSLYSYAGGNPLKYIDPRGESLGAVVFTATGFGIMIAGTIWLVQDCVKKCDTNCPIAGGGAEAQDYARNRHILDCKAKCANLFTELWMKIQNARTRVTRTAHASVTR